MHRTMVYLTENQWDQIGVASQEKGIRHSEMIRRIIDAYFDNSNSFSIENKDLFYLKQNSKTIERLLKIANK